MKLETASKLLGTPVVSGLALHDLIAEAYMKLFLFGFTVEHENGKTVARSLKSNYLSDSNIIEEAHYSWNLKGNWLADPLITTYDYFSKYNQSIILSGISHLDLKLALSNIADADSVFKIGLERMAIVDKSGIPRKDLGWSISYLTTK